MLQHGVEHDVALGIAQHELLGEIGKDATALATRIEHTVDGTFLAVEIESTLAIKHRGHDGKYTLVGAVERWKLP